MAEVFKIRCVAERQFGDKHRCWKEEASGAGGRDSSASKRSAGLVA